MASHRAPRARPEAGFTRSYLIKSPPLQRKPPPPLEPPGAHGADVASDVTCHGLLADPILREGRRERAPEAPDPLVFYSWWNEESATPPELTRSGSGMGVRRQVRLHYSPKAGIFQLFTDDSKLPLSIAIEHADGTPVGAYELHVGTKLDVLGRPMTLRSASSKTIGWIDAEAKRLLKRREGLCVQISRFQDVAKAMLSCGFSGLYLNRQMAPSSHAVAPTGGQADLHRLTLEIRAMERLLVRYRS